jgi:hypothetical protein
MGNMILLLLTIHYIANYWGVIRNTSLFILIHVNMTVAVHRKLNVVDIWLTKSGAITPCMPLWPGHGQLYI